MDCQLSLDKQLIQQVAVPDTYMPTQEAVFMLHKQPLNFTSSTSDEEKGRWSILLDWMNYPVFQVLLWLQVLIKHTAEGGLEILTSLSFWMSANRKALI